MPSYACGACGKIGPKPFCPGHKPKTSGPRSPSSRQTGTRAWRASKPTILRRDKHVCQWCRGRASTVDHLTPVAYGGSNQPGNLNASCDPCNQARNRKAAPRGISLYATIGAPGSGKTTWANQQPHRTLSLDDYRGAGPWTYDGHRRGLTRLIKDAVAHADTERTPLIVDTTGSTAQLRGAIRHTADRIGYELHGLLFLAPLPVLLARDQQRPTPIGAQHVSRIHRHVLTDLPLIRMERWASLTTAELTRAA